LPAEIREIIIKRFGERPFWDVGA